MWLAAMLKGLIPLALLQSVYAKVSYSYRVKILKDLRCVSCHVESPPGPATKCYEVYMQVTCSSYYTYSSQKQQQNKTGLNCMCYIQFICMH